MYKYFMSIGLAVVGLGWIIYGIYNYIADRREKNQSEVRSQQYEQAQGSMTDYAKKMATFKKKRYDKPQ